MAGSYSDAPSRRMAYDDDGTVGFKCDCNVNEGPNADEFDSEFTPGNLATMNNQDADGVSGLSNRDTGYYLIFPELREIDGAVCTATTGTGQQQNFGMYAVGASTVTNPFTGWVQSVAAGSTPNLSVDVRDRYRTDIVSMAEPSRRGFAAMRTPGSGSMAQMHVYGEISPGETPDKVLIIDENTGVEFTAPKDYGDIPRGSSEDIEIRLRNDSASLTVNTVQYTVEALGVDGGGGYGGGNGWYTSTLPGGSTFQATNQIASIASATTTGIITLRRITPGDEEPRLFAPRLQVTHASFT
jgi:hypothetical protein